MGREHSPYKAARVGLTKFDMEQLKRKEPVAARRCTCPSATIHVLQGTDRPVAWRLISANDYTISGHPPRLPGTICAQPSTSRRGACSLLLYLLSPSMNCEKPTESSTCAPWESAGNDARPGKAEPPSTRPWFCYTPRDEVARPSKAMVEKDYKPNTQTGQPKGQIPPARSPAGQQKPKQLLPEGADGFTKFKKQCIIQPLSPI